MVTQNGDGLHLRAGNTLDRTYQIHGNIDFMRCSRECLPAPLPMPDGVDVAWDKGRPVSERELAALKCPSCGAPGRPHVLWFDEYYTEHDYRSESAMLAAAVAVAVLPRTAAPPAQAEGPALLAGAVPMAA